MAFSGSGGAGADARQRAITVQISQRRSSYRSVISHAVDGVIIMLAYRQPQISTRRRRMSQNMTQSPARLKSGYVKVAGRFFSKKKWPTQAKP